MLANEDYVNLGMNSTEARPIGRPVGSTNGRRPPGGYPRLSPESRSFLAGFVEGEASFGIAKQTHHSNHKCKMRLTARDDDSVLLHELASTTRLGTVISVPNTSGSHKQVAWRVEAKADCLRLVEILDQYPLRGRKSLDYAIWRTALRWWVNGDPTRRESGRDWSAMIYLKERLQEAKLFSQAERRRTLNDFQGGLWADWPGYIAGFFTAEGCLGIYFNGSGFVPKLKCA
jgi:hypothetical protein